MRNMSFSMTTKQIRNRTKTVTRRLGWKFLQSGQLIRAVEKGMGLKKGEKTKELAILRIVSVRREQLNWIYYTDPYNELIREGFPHMITSNFIDMFCSANKCTPESEITRIEFEYADEYNRR